MSKLVTSLLSGRRRLEDNVSRGRAGNSRDKKSKVQAASVSLLRSLLLLLMQLTRVEMRIRD